MKRRQFLGGFSALTFGLFEKRVMAEVGVTTPTTINTGAWGIYYNGVIEATAGTEETAQQIADQWSYNHLANHLANNGRHLRNWQQSLGEHNISYEVTDTGIILERDPPLNSLKGILNALSYHPVTVMKVETYSVELYPNKVPTGEFLHPKSKR